MLDKMEILRAQVVCNFCWADPYRILTECLHCNETEISWALADALPELQPEEYEVDESNQMWLNTDGLVKLAQKLPQGRGASLVRALEELE